MKTNYLILLFAIFLFTSCSTGKYYANYRAGGKSKKENPKAIESGHSVSASSPSFETEEMVLVEMSCLDTFTLQKNKCLRNEKTRVPLKNQPQQKYQGSKKLKDVHFTSKKTTIRHAFKKNHQKPRSTKKKNHRFLKCLILVGIIFGLFLLAQMLGLTSAFWITIGIIAAGVAGFLIASYLFVELIFWFVGELFGAIYLSHAGKKSPFKSVDHGERISTIFWVLIGLVVLAGIVGALVMIPEAVTILLGLLVVVLIALLLGAVLAAFIDLIMPGDSMF